MKITRRFGGTFGTLAIAIASVACSSEAEEQGPRGPCDALGSWTVSYEPVPVEGSSLDPPTLADDTLALTQVDTSVSVQYADEEPDEWSLSDDGCELHIIKNRYWEAGGEPWKDERELTLQFDGDTATGPLLYGCSWCPGSGGSYEYVAHAVRVQ